MGTREGRKGTRRARGMTVLSIAWYRREQWERLREISADRDDLESNYEEWRLAAEKTFLELCGARMAPVKALVDVEEPLSWCQSQGRPVDAKARAEFAIVCAQKAARRSR